LQNTAKKVWDPGDEQISESENSNTCIWLC